MVATLMRLARVRSPYVQVLLVAVIVMLLGGVACAAGGEVNYRKPPFNGSIFGKRNSGLAAARFVGQDERGVCEVLLDACGQLLQNVLDQQQQGV